MKPDLRVLEEHKRVRKRNNEQHVRNAQRKARIKAAYKQYELEVNELILQGYSQQSAQALAQENLDRARQLARYGGRP